MECDLDALSALVRRTFVFGIRGQLPVPNDGWTIVLHDDRCVHDGDAADCAGAVACKFGAWEVDDPFVFDGSSRVMAAAAAVAGQTPTEYEGAPVGFPRLSAIAAVSVGIRQEEADPFDEALGFLTQGSRALLQATGALEPPVTRQQLLPFYAIVDEAADGELRGPSLVIFEDAYMGPARATASQTERAERHLSAALSRDPVEIYHHFKLEARRALSAIGHYEDAVLKAATACEVLIKHVAWYLTWEATEILAADPCPDAETGPEVITSKPGVLIGSVLAPRLRGSWDSRRTDAPVARWRNSIARLRNRVVHLGHRPSEAEAAEAVAVVEVLEKHVMDKLAVAVATYPRTALKLVHRDGLERRSLFTRRARAVWDAESLGEHLRAYTAWLELRALNTDE